MKGGKVDLRKSWIRITTPKRINFKPQPLFFIFGNNVAVYTMEEKVKKIREEVQRIGEEAYEQYRKWESEQYGKWESDKSYWTYMTCKKITEFIDSI